MPHGDRVYKFRCKELLCDYYLRRVRRLIKYGSVMTHNKIKHASNVKGKKTMTIY